MVLQKTLVRREIEDSWIDGRATARIDASLGKRLTMTVVLGVPKHSTFVF